MADDAKNNPWKGWGLNKKIIDDYKGTDDVLFLCVGNHENYPPESNIRYEGHINDKETLSLYYNAADVLLFTSLAENFPLVILEAMSTGLPIVGFDVGGVKEVLTHKENGYIAQYKNIKDVENGLDWVLNLSMEERNKISENSGSKIKNHFDVSRMNSEYLNLYKEIKTNSPKNEQS